MAARDLYVGGSRASSIVPIDTATYKAAPPIPIDGPTAALATAPNGKTLYVALTDTSAPQAQAIRYEAPSTVVPLNTATLKAGAAIQVGRAPDALAVTPDGKTLYVANFLDNTVTPVPTASGKPMAPISVANGPIGLAINSPSGRQG